MKISRFVMVSLILISLILTGCGRTTSRFLGKDHCQVLKVENLQQFINISFRKANILSTVKNVTFLATDGYVYTQEFKDVSPLEGLIRWVPNGQDESFIRTRAISRLTGKAVNLELPEDCIKILGVDVERKAKNLAYLSTDGKVYTKEYRDGVIVRNFEGWLEITSK